jgi:hypothetical protein
MKDGQAPARRFGAMVAIIISCLACACLGGAWYLFAREGIDSLVRSVSLTANGATTTGTVSEVEEFRGGNASLPSISYKLTVTYEVAGRTYSVTSNSYYKPISKSWVGETMPIIYAPDDPSIALIDTFQERWLAPIVNSAP